MSCVFGGTDLTNGSGTRVHFKQKIRAATEVKGVCVVVLDVPPGCAMTENVFGVSADDGRKLWQIEKIASTGPCYLEIMTPFKPHAVRLWTWEGLVIDVDVRDGKVIKKVLRK
jgi:hypothetical protein